MLKLAKNSNLTDIVSTDGSNPIITQHPITGSSQVVQLYLFNDDAMKKYQSITIDPTDITGSDESSYIQLSLDGVTYLSGSASLSMTDVADNNVGHMFYAKVTTPAVAETQNKTDIKLTVNYTEFAV